MKRVMYYISFSLGMLLAGVLNAHAQAESSAATPKAKAVQKEFAKEYRARRAREGTPRDQDCSCRGSAYCSCSPTSGNGYGYGYGYGGYGNPGWSRSGWYGGSDIPTTGYSAPVRR